MKKILSVLGALALLFVGFLFTSCDGLIDGDEINNYATTTVDSVSFTTAKAGPGVNVLKWNAVRDVTGYSVYRTINGDLVEQDVTSNPADLYFIDMDVDQNTSYTYRVVAHPSDTVMHDESEKKVTLSTGTWPSEGTAFAKLEGGSDNGLSSDKITLKLYPTSKSNTVRASFPVKPYATYTVFLSQENGGLVDNSQSIDSSVTINGYDYDGKATVDLTALYTGEKQVTVVATPLNTTLYGSSIVASKAKVEVVDAETISSATASGVEALWTNYNKETCIATARVYFAPYVYYGEEFATSEYTIYRALYDSNGETIDVNGDGLCVYKSITNLGSPKIDVEKSSGDQTIYYLDDTEIDLTYSNDISGVRYYLILNHNGTFKSQNTALDVPNTSDSDWKFTPASAPSSETTYTNSITVRDLHINEDKSISIELSYDNNSKRVSSTDAKGETVYETYYTTVSATYGTFDTKNEALVAVKSELPTAIESSTADSSYWNATLESAAFDSSKYYAFRFVSSFEFAADDVAVFIAKPVHNLTFDMYYWDVVSGNPYNYGVPSPSVSANVTAGTTNYEKVDLSYYTSYANYYRLSRSSYNNSSYSYSNTTVLDEKSANYSYIDTEVTDISVDDFITYYIDTIGYYGVDSDSITVSALSTPSVTLAGSTLSWPSVSNATQYYIYRAATEDALNSLSESDYYASTYSTSYTLSNSYTSDYWYGVRACRYNYSTGASYSALSNTFKVTKVSAPVISLNATDGVTISWTSISDASGYRIYRATSEAALESLSDSDYIATTTSTSYVAKKVLGTAYYYAVKAYSGSNVTVLSNAVTVDAGTDSASWTKSSTDGTYYFTEGSDNVWSSNNQGINSSTATSTWTISLTTSATVNIPWSISSETRYDKLTITLDDSDVVYQQSGNNSNTYTATLTAGSHNLTATYEKDGSGNSDTDTATVTLEPVVF